MEQTLNITLANDEQIEKISDALSSKIRRKILLMVRTHSYSENDLASKLNISPSTCSFHLKLLKEAGLIKIVGNKEKRGNEKIIYQGINTITFDLYGVEPSHKSEKTKVIEIPVGSYFNADIDPNFTSGLADKDGYLIGFDNPGVFFSPLRFNARLLYFGRGFVEYKIPLYDLEKAEIKSLSLALEICSECPMSNLNWKSDIDFFFNGVSVLTYRSPSDFGDRRGNFTPKYWSAVSTQYGLMKNIKITEDGTYLDGKLVNKTTINNLRLNEEKMLTIRIASLDSSKYPGGVNIFGKGFGDFNEEMHLTIAYNEK